MKHVVILGAALFCAACPLTSIRAADTPLVNHGDTWRWHKGNTPLQTDWKTASDAGLDGTWLSGMGGFGYSTDTPNETNLCKTILADMRNAYTTVYLRRQFSIAAPMDPSLHLQLTMDYDDGFIVWLDGNYLTNALVSGAPNEPATNATATATHESSRGTSNPVNPPTTFDFGPIGSRLDPGTHILAIIGVNQATGSSDLIQIADLFAAPPPVPLTNIWSLVNSPILVSADFTVSANSTLLIEPGVVVQFGAGVDLTVANGGRLLAVGTSNAPILFTRSGASSWGGITVAGGVGSPETKISYARFEFNGSTAIHASGGSLSLDHVNFTATDHQYLSLDGASFVVSDCHFPSATALFENVHGTSGIKTGGRGIFIRNFFGVANSVSGNYNDVLDFTGGNRPGPITQFIDNVFIGSDDDLLDLDSTDAWIEHNIFLHVHKNGSPDSASAVSGGRDNNDTSQITILGNLIYDCDQAATAKQGNFYTLINNTIVHQTKTGGVDTDSGVVNLADDGTVEGAGFYLEGNIIYDAENLVRNLTSATVTFNNNLMPLAWAGPGTGNSTANPMLKHVPQLSETVFTNWSEAQIMWDWFSLLPGSPGLGTGPNGRDLGGVIPIGASISGEPVGSTSQTSATLTVGVNRTGNGMPVAGWPNGSGYTHYKWRLDGGSWSAETPMATPISLNNLGSGAHYVEVVGKRDSDWYQDDPIFGEDAIITRSRTWTVSLQPRIDSISLVSPTQVEIHFTAQANKGYAIEFRESLSAGDWQPLVHLDPIPTSHAVTFPDALSAGLKTRFYRLVEQ
jgi:hypothetical protein